MKICWLFLHWLYLKFTGYFGFIELKLLPFIRQTIRYVNFFLMKSNKELILYQVVTKLHLVIHNKQGQGLKMTWNGKIYIYNIYNFSLHFCQFCFIYLVLCSYVHMFITVTYS